METYIEELREALLFPTLTEKCKHLSRCGITPIPGINTHGTMGEMVHSASVNYLERIHQEIFDGKSEKEQNEILKDRELLALEHTGQPLTTDLIRPVLCDEYLRSIGREDLIDFGTE
jgi:hypothetical protein